MFLKRFGKPIPPPSRQRIDLGEPIEKELGTATLHQSPTLIVTASWQDGDLLIYGQDLGPGTPTDDEYEYWLTVPRDQLRQILSDIGTDETDPVEFLEQLALHGDRIDALRESG